MPRSKRRATTRHAGAKEKGPSTAPLRARIPGPLPDLDDPNLYINRELSWLQFNHRVLEESLDARHPLLERVKFLAIFANNLDEFFMIRVAGLRWQLAAGTQERSSDGMTPEQQLAAIRREVLPEVATATEHWHATLLPLLRETGIRILDYSDLKRNQRRLLREYFERELFPALTPLAFDPGHPFPHISNLSMNLAVVVRDPREGERFARIKVPDTFPRLLRIPSEEASAGYGSLGVARAASNRFVWTEQVVAANLDMLFPGLEVAAAHPFRVTRDADLEIEEDEAADLLAAVEHGVGMRHFGSPVRLEVDGGTPDRIRDILSLNLGLAPYQVYAMPAPMGLADLMQLASIDRPDLKDAPFVASTPPALQSDPFAAIRHGPVFLYHPYDSFAPVVDFLNVAARDPSVIAIKQVLYRVGKNSPVVAALMEARDQGKQVAVLVELKARFDEEHNIEWARALEHAGIHVVYGLVGLKTHAKLCLVVRREADGIVRYVHLGTGNYNESTARVYSDMGYFTSDPDVGADASDLFNALTGYSRNDTYRTLIVAPGRMRDEIITRIDRERERHMAYGDGRIAFKLNGLVDKECIQALYRASHAGVPIDLQVRSICCLRPGVPGVSDTIRVTSVVGRFLEHARIFYFHNGGDEEVLLGSADLMPRNLYRRVEVVFPVRDAHLKTRIREILEVHLGDTAQARRLMPDGAYERCQPPSGEAPSDSQAWMVAHRGSWHQGTGSP
ncbi:MAG: polyphosphate kinase 1 [Candidatus Eisenbacteria bacterium]|nr:polyphosphate kinase 1 [Candidatus Eisenbacteria bacterium]